MREDLVNRWSTGRIVVKDLLNKISGWFCDIDVLWEGIVVHSDPLVGGLNIVGLKGRLSND